MASIGTANYRKEALFDGLDFQAIAQDRDFKEDSVREVIVLPLIYTLGYDESNIVRSKRLEHPYLKIGSKKRKLSLVPDYLLEIDSRTAWVLDAKAPTQKIVGSEHIEQVYSYATHREVRSKYFCLCNGLEFAIYLTTGNETPRLYFRLEEIAKHWQQFSQILGIGSFQSGKEPQYTALRGHQKDFCYKDKPLLEELPVIKRAAKRHFGVHGYFTRQSWNVVAEYIRNYTQEGDLVLDPFGGSGVTAIEAMMNQRHGIHIDLNPMAVFLPQALAAPVDLGALGEAYHKVVKAYRKAAPRTEQETQDALKKYPYPLGWPLPKGSDVETVEQLFSSKQLAELATLKHYILEQKDEHIRHTLLLMFSGLITRHNLTVHSSAQKKTPDAAPFRYYRYRLAPEPMEIIDLLYYFELRYQKVVAAKREMAYYINSETIENLDIRKGSASDLSFLKNESVDYIYTDPPYGKKIPYLDLSVMWNVWLDLEVSEQDYREEAIEGGEAQHTKEHYNGLIAQSIREMYRVLKFDRWLSFVFAHKDPEFWHLIIDTAEDCGFEYIGAVSQKNGQTSFKKRKNPFTVLSGQLIINFRKVRSRPKAILKANLGMNIADIITQTIEGIVAKYNGATLEQINDELIIKGLELGFLDLLRKQYKDLSPLLEGFDYDEEKEVFTLKRGGKFQTHINLDLRIRYYLISYLTRKQRENINPHFDDIVLSIMPLLKNGDTPAPQNVLSVLKGIAQCVEQDSWRLDDRQLFRE